jgi:hypothetical protein
MKCSQCEQKTKVVDSRQLVSGDGHPFTWRRLKCSEGHISYTYEVNEGISPIKEKVRYIIRVKKNEYDYVVNTRKKKRKKDENKNVQNQEQVHEGAMQQLGIKVTKSSPEWLKRIALQLE